MLVVPEALPGFTTACISQTIEAQWTALKKTLPQDHFRLPVGQAVDSLLNGFRVAGFSSGGRTLFQRPRELTERLVHGQPVAAERIGVIRGVEPQAHIPCARLYIQYAPNNFAVSGQHLHVVIFVVLFVCFFFLFFGEGAAVCPNSMAVCFQGSSQGPRCRSPLSVVARCGARLCPAFASAKPANMRRRGRLHGEVTGEP